MVFLQEYHIHFLAETIIVIHEIEPFESNLFSEFRHDPHKAFFPVFTPEKVFFPQRNRYRFDELLIIYRPVQLTMLGVFSLFWIKPANTCGISVPIR